MLWLACSHRNGHHCSIIRRYLPSLINFSVRALASTLRLSVVDRSGVVGREHADRPVIWVFWHNNILVASVAYMSFFSFRRGVCLTSPSKDGGLIAGVMAKFGVGSVRGSSSRRGATAVRELVAAMKEGKDVIVTPDGPRGPKYTLNPGVIKIGQLTQALLVPVHVRYSAYWQLKTWDGFRIPKPFSKIQFIIAEAHRIAEDKDADGCESDRVRLQSVLLEGVDQPILDSLAG